MTKDNQNSPKSNATSGGNGGASGLWGGRFSGGPSDVMQAINASIDVDRHLFKEDINGSRAHAKMLADCGIISTEDEAAIQNGLNQVEGEIARGEMVFDPALEDIHLHVEARLTELIGDAGKRLHTGRSRNDQVATDFRLFVRDAFDRQAEALTRLMTAFVDQADAHADTVMPGFTHLQTAQPVTLGHHLMAYAEMLLRDRGRMTTARTRMNESPLGAAALAGTGFPIDRHQTAKTLSFSGPMRNSLDAVSARDFALDYLHAASMTALSLSRFAEELVIWASAPFRFVTLDDGFSTGSSIMPQKRNPDAAELVRAKVGKMLGAFQSLAVVMKGLPLAYSKDMQEDKASLMAASADMDLVIAAMTGMVETLAPNADALRAAAAGGFSTATDLADALVRDLGMPFRDAHHVTGQVVKLAENKDCMLDQLSLDDMQSVEPRITQTILDSLTVEASVASRNSFGGTAPERVREAITLFRSTYLPLEA